MLGQQRDLVFVSHLLQSVLPQVHADTGIVYVISVHRHMPEPIQWLDGQYFTRVRYLLRYCSLK